MHQMGSESVIMDGGRKLGQLWVAEALKRDGSSPQKVNSGVETCALLKFFRRV